MRRVVSTITLPISLSGGTSGGSFTPTLVPIDGGSTYYSTNSFTYAASSRTWNPSALSSRAAVTYAAGWDDPTFFPIGLWLTTIAVGNSFEAAAWIDCGINTTWVPSNAGSAGNLAIFKANGISVWLSYQYLGAVITNEPRATGSSAWTASDCESVGISTYDEPDVVPPIAEVPVQGMVASVFSGTLVPGQITNNSFVSGGTRLLAADSQSFGPGAVTGSGVTAGTLLTGYSAGTTGTGAYNSNTSQSLTTNLTMAAIPALPDALQDHRPLWTNFAGIKLMPDGTPAGTTISAILNSNWTNPSSLTSRHTDLISIDWYFHAIAHCNDAHNNALNCAKCYDSSTSSHWTMAQCAVAGHYGDMIDYMRGFQAAIHPAPLGLFIEIGNGFVDLSANWEISPCELSWTVWSTIIHGARQIMYFNTSGDGSGSYSPSASPSMGVLGSTYSNTVQTATFSGTLSGTTLTATGSVTGPQVGGTIGQIATGMVNTSGTPGTATILQQTSNFTTSGIGGAGTDYKIIGTISNGTMTFAHPTIAPTGVTGTLKNMTKYINALVTTMAPVLNSQFVTNFLTADASLRYIFPGVGTKTVAYALIQGVDCCVKKYNGSTYTTAGYNITGESITAGYYIFATTNYAETASAITATFKVATGSSVTVINESRSIPISGGQFTDTFDFAWTVHIYKVNP